MDFLDQLEEIGRPSIQQKPWMSGKTMSLVTRDTLSQVVDECIASGLYAIDLETSGLDNRVFHGATKDHIVGVCLSPDGERGYYIPVRHHGHMEQCVPFSEFSTQLRRLVESPAIAIFHNGKFDQEFLQFNGGAPIGEWDDPKKWEDTLILAYLRNSRERNKGLKHLSKVLLSMEMIELEELFTKEEADQGLDFGRLDPSWGPSLWYAASDAICTYLLYKRLRDEALNATESGLPAQTTIYHVEKLCVAATRWMERNRIPIDRAKVEELIRVGQREWLPALREVYEATSKALGRNIAPGYFQLLDGTDDRFRFNPERVELGIMEVVGIAREESVRQRLDPVELDEKGRLRVKTIQKRVPNLVDKKVIEPIDFPKVYDVLIPEQLGLLLRELGVQGLHVTEKSGQVMTSKDELDRVIEDAGDEFPYLVKVKRFREIAKALASNLLPIYEATSKALSPDGRIRINFEAFKADTGRFSTPQDSEKRAFTGKARWNLHSIPATYDPHRPECMARIREVIRAEKGKKLYACDYSGQELRVVTNLSGEPLWVKEFFRCSSCNLEFPRGEIVPPPPEAPPPFCPKCGSDKIGDLHTLTAIAIFGPDAMSSPEGKQRRSEAKSVNFALCYGGGGMAVVRAAGVTKDEGWRIKKQFDNTYKGLAGWWGRQHEFARRTKHVLTAFNRRYPLPDIDSADGRFRSKAERNAVNGPIQGCLHPDGRVPTDGGLLRVEDLYKRMVNGGSTRFKVWTGKDWKEARPLLSGPKRLYETTLEDGGTLLTSPEHLFRVWDSKQGNFVWVRQHDLVHGDWVARDAGVLDIPAPTYTFADGETAHNTHGFCINGNNPVLWEFLGRLIGDGSMCEDGLIVHVGGVPAYMADKARVCGYTAEGYAQDFARRVAEALGLSVTVTEKKQFEGGAPQNTWQVQVWDRAFIRFCTEVLGLKAANCRGNEFPSAVWHESLIHRASFLRGYMDADGEITPGMGFVGLRSANPKRLRETYLLFRSVGVRVSCRLRSQLVSVLDRQAFHDVVGFGVSYKAACLTQMVEGPQTNRNNRLPPDVVQMIGNALRACPGYESLPRVRKSAVLRMVAGSGSKAQCLRLAADCGMIGLGEHLESILAYDYSRVVSKRDTGDTVTMYDVEVFDDDHAFACDGVIVHNTGADLMKWSMGLIYRECKKRNWLDRVKAIITIHDELVFEVDDDLAGEAIPVLIDIMLKKSTSRLAWRVPLTCDIECGHDWTVPWNITKIMHGKKSVPPELEGVFTPIAKTEPVLQAIEHKPAVSEHNSEIGIPTSPVGKQAVSVTESFPLAAEIPTLARGEPFVYVFHSNTLSMRFQRKLAKVILQCRGRGTNPFHPVNERNEPLWDGPEILVNPVEVGILLSMPDV